MRLSPHNSISVFCELQTFATAFKQLDIAAKAKQFIRQFLFVDMLNIYLILVALSMAIGTTVASITAPEKEESLLECAKYVGSYCGNEVLDTLSNKKSNVSTDCCYKIIQTGYSCHTKLTLFVLQNDSEFKHANVTNVLEKNDRIFDMCDKATEPESEMYLSKCVVKIGTECGEEVFDNLKHNKNNVTDCCCGRLVETGLPCHINMAKALIRTPEMRNVDAIEFLNKGKKLFDECLEDQE
ncbi:hypothetical protein JHK86_016434 [Glycine max]|nr:hypothetical protein JHK86_016434 [Glycine max]